MTKYYEIPEYSFSKTGNNEEVIINIGTEEEVNIEDLLRAFKGFLVASGFAYVKHVDVRIDDTSYIHSSSDDDPIDERNPYEIATDLGS
jgi:hypothetical protein